MELLYDGKAMSVEKDYQLSCLTYGSQPTAVITWWVGDNQLPYDSYVTKVTHLFDEMPSGQHTHTAEVWILAPHPEIAWTERIFLWGVHKHWEEQPGGKEKKNRPATQGVQTSWTFLSLLFWITVLSQATIIEKQTSLLSRFEALICFLFFFSLQYARNASGR